MTLQILTHPPVTRVAGRAVPPPRRAPTAQPPPATPLPVHRADSAPARLRGLLGRRHPPPFALRLEPCRCVHTFGMRFAVDLHWLDRDGAPLRVDRAVPPWRVRGCRQARAVVEVPVGASILEPS